jgi:hypothetical protein
MSSVSQPPNQGFTTKKKVFIGFIVVIIGVAIFFIVQAATGKNILPSSNSNTDNSNLINKKNNINAQNSITEDIKVKQNSENTSQGNSQ